MAVEEGVSLAEADLELESSVLVEIFFVVDFGSFKFSVVDYETV